VTIIPNAIHHGIGPDGNTDISFHQGVISVWNSTTFSNIIQIAGATIQNVPILTTAGLSALRAGDTVAILQYKNSYFILGRIVSLTNPLVEPQFPIVLYPMFATKVAPGDGGFMYVDVGKLVTWEGRIRVSHPKIEVDGIWGATSGTNTVRYEMKLSNNVIGFWVVSAGITVSRFGPFDISPYVGQDWARIEIGITSSTGTGTVAFQLLGCYFRQT